MPKCCCRLAPFLAGATLRELRSRQRFNANVLALNRANSTLRDRLGRGGVERVRHALLHAPLDALRGCSNPVIWWS